MIVHPVAVQRPDIQPIEDAAPVNRREDLANQEGDSTEEPRQQDPEEDTPGDQEDLNLAPLNFNDFED